MVETAKDDPFLDSEAAATKEQRAFGWRNRGLLSLSPTEGGGGGPARKGGRRDKETASAAMMPEEDVVDPSRRARKERKEDPDADGREATTESVLPPTGERSPSTASPFMTNLLKRTTLRQSVLMMERQEVPEGKSVG